jgi:hypothetical protein
MMRSRNQAQQCDDTQPAQATYATYATDVIPMDGLVEGLGRECPREKSGSTGDPGHGMIRGMERLSIIRAH